MRDTLKLNPGVIMYLKGWRRLGTLGKRGIFRNPFLQSIFLYYSGLGPV